MNRAELNALGAAVMAALFILGLWCWYLGVIPTFNRLDSLRTVVLAGVFYPICEEIIFRGLIQQELLKLKTLNKNCLPFNARSLTLANVITSIVFAFMHVLYFQSVGAFVVVIPSLIFGGCFEVRKKLLLPILVHGIYNLLGLLAPAFYSA
ncbi:hypothetical protein MAH4_11450 [Sessilibacter sp. MAH4]